MSKILQLKMTLDMADPTEATHFVFWVNEATTLLGLDDEWWMKTLKVTPQKKKSWMRGMTPSIQERLEVYKALKEAAENAEASNSSSERFENEEGQAGSPGSSRIDEGSTRQESEPGPLKAAS